jgi:hypothetical protein
MSARVSPGKRSVSRRRLALAGSALLVVVAVVVGVLLGTGGHRTPSAAGGTGAPAATAGAVPLATDAPTPPPTPVPTGPTRNVDRPAASLTPVALDHRAAVGNGISATIGSIEAIQGEGTGRGNVAGPALRVTVLLENGTSAPVSVDAVTVGLASGSDLAPASPLDDPSAAPFTGMLQPGKQATGVYVFSIPENRRTPVTVSVGYQAGAPIMVFRGSAR